MDPALQERFAEEVEVVEQVELSDDESDLGSNDKYEYEQVPDIEDDSDLEKDEDLATALMAVAMKSSKEKGMRGDRKALNKKSSNNKKKLSTGGSGDEAKYNEGSEYKEEEGQDFKQEESDSMINESKVDNDEDRIGSSKNQPVTQVRPSVMDDFLRKFLIKVGMKKTLDTFNTEWYELLSKGKLSPDYTSAVPDIYVRNQELDDNVHIMSEKVAKMQEIAAKAQGTWDKFRKERDFHRMHHKRVVIEKNKLVTDLRRLQKHFDKYEPTLNELKKKYETAMKDKMLIRLDRDKLKAKVSALEEQIKILNNESNEDKGPVIPTKSILNQTQKRAAKLPVENPPNPFDDLEFDPPKAENFNLKKTFRGHLNSISGSVFHPKKPVLATVSDDETWKLWSVPNCELIMSGEGHTDWLSGVDFHPHGTHLATSGGDQTVKLWEFKTSSCIQTFTEHTQAVWGTAFHYTGDFLASCSMDHTSRLWDLSTMKCKTTFRGHVDSVNAIVWQPYTNNLCSASGDKTVSIWDARSSLCVQTFYGHLNACNHVAVTKKGDMLASCDADGMIKLWDVRMVAEIGTIESGYYPINQISLDRTGTRLAAASDDGSIKIFDTQSQELLQVLKGHDDAVQTVHFDPTDNMLISGSSDCTFRIWS